MALRWGCVTAGKICSDFVSCLRSLPESHQVVAVAARDINNAQGFADQHGIPQAYQGYEQLAKDPNVDIAYIGSLHNYHHGLAKLMLQHGKHVLCEKPLCVTQAQAKEVIGLAKEGNVFFMEAIWSRFFPAYHKIREVLAGGELGQVRLVTANFGDYVTEGSRLDKDTPGGAILDLGIYTYQLASMVYGGQQPTSVSTTGFLRNTGGVDDTSSTVLKYPNDCIAVLNTSIGCPLPNEAYIMGTMKKLKLCDPFWCPTRIEISDADNNVEVFEYPLPDIKGSLNFRNQQGMQYMASAVGNYIRDGAKESPLITQNESIVLAGIMDKARHDLGFYLDNEK